MGETWVKKGNLASEKKIHEIMEVSSVFYPIDKTLQDQKQQLAVHRFSCG